MSWTIDNARMQIIGNLNRNAVAFPELKKEMFFYNPTLKCFVSDKKGVKMNCYFCNGEVDKSMRYYYAVDEQDRYCCVDCYEKVVIKQKG